MSLEARVVVRMGPLELDVELAVARGELVVLLGPNGAGKTTLLRALAGLVPLASGRVELDGVVLDNPGAGVWVPPERRPVGVVFQDLLLFPHLSARENIAFGLRCRGVARGKAREQAARWLERVGLAERAGARPAALSGGQAQRVALARALATEPSLLLLDEPLAALDASARPAMRRELRRELAAYGGARLLVTHDPVEAMALADRIVVLEEGRVVQSGTPAQVRERPRSRYVADLVGVNLWQGRGGPDGVVLASGAVLVAPDVPAGDVLAVVHPHAVMLHRDRPVGSARNVWECVVADVDPEGERVRVRLDGPVELVAEVTAAAASDLALSPGTRVWAAIKATEIAVHPE